MKKVLIFTFKGKVKYRKCNIMLNIEVKEKKKVRENIKERD